MALLHVPGVQACRESQLAPGVFHRPKQYGRVVKACSHQSTRRELLLASQSLAAVSVLPKVGRAEDESIYGLSALQYGEDVNFNQFKDKVTNVNYPGLRALYDKYNSQGFNLVAFPCNQFGGQAPGSSQEEREYAYKKFGFEFPVMDKIEVNGENTHPIYRILKEEQPKDLPSGLNVGFEKGRIAWNYTKFLVDRSGRGAARFGPSYDPLKFEPYVKRLLAGKEVPPLECLKHPGRAECRA